MIRKIIRIILAIYTASLPIFGFGIIVGILYFTNDSLFFKYILPGVILIVSIILSIKIYQGILSRGYVDFMSYNNRDLYSDEIYNEKNMLTPKELVARFESGNLLFKIGLVEIWGDKRGRGLDTKNKIESINLHLDILVIAFTNGNILRISKTNLIIDESTYLKIPKASKIVWTTNNGLSNYTYQVEANKIRTISNEKWKRKDLDVLTQSPAVFIYKI